VKKAGVNLPNGSREPPIVLFKTEMERGREPEPPAVRGRKGIVLVDVGGLFVVCGLGLRSVKSLNVELGENGGVLMLEGHWR
jgi:hypothetical protein